MEEGMQIAQYGGLDARVSLKRELPRMCTTTPERGSSNGEPRGEKKGMENKELGDKCGAQLTASHLASDGAD